MNCYKILFGATLTLLLISCRRYDNYLGVYAYATYSGFDKYKHDTLSLFPSGRGVSKLSGAFAYTYELNNKRYGMFCDQITINYDNKTLEDDTFAVSYSIFYGVRIWISVFDFDSYYEKIRDLPESLKY